MASSHEYAYHVAASNDRKSTLTAVLSGCMLPLTVAAAGDVCLQHVHVPPLSSHGSACEPLQRQLHTTDQAPQAFKKGAASSLTASNLELVRKS